MLFVDLESDNARPAVIIGIQKQPAVNTLRSVLATAAALLVAALGGIS